MSPGNPFILGQMVKVTNGAQKHIAGVGHGSLAIADFFVLCMTALAHSDLQQSEGPWTILCLAEITTKPSLGVAPTIIAQRT